MGVSDCEIELIAERVLRKMEDLLDLYILAFALGDYIASVGKAQACETPSHKASADTDAEGDGHTPCSTDCASSVPEGVDRRCGSK
ncbi:MAG: hypothetical protein DRO73_08480 [Candidatus Thorarchaeota archaeon]|nr:MAG: hypothetical protein DRO73_08480 [Candidatus Thorarchaeota archaeon]